MRKLMVTALLVAASALFLSGCTASLALYPPWGSRPGSTAQPQPVQTPSPSPEVK